MYLHIKLNLKCTIFLIISPVGSPSSMASKIKITVIRGMRINNTTPLFYCVALCKVISDHDHAPVLSIV